MKTVFMQSNNSATPTAGVTVPPSVAVTGTAASGWYESEVVAGGQTIILTVTNGAWVAAGSTFDAQRQNILNGITSAQGEANGWNAKRSGLAVTDVVRTSATVVTITLNALATYSVTAAETLTVTVPSGALTAGVSAVATPTLTIIEGSPSTSWLANRPAGYNTLVTDLDMSQAVPTWVSGTERVLADPNQIWAVLFDDNNENTGSNFSLVTDATEPKSPSTAWRLQQQAGTYGGGVPGVGSGKGWGNLGCPLPATQGLYYCMSVKWSANYYAQPVSHKFWFGEVSGGGVYVQYCHYSHFLRCSDEALGQAYEPQISTQPSLDVWHQLEWQFERGNPGIVKVWLDGELRTSYTNLPVGTTSPNFYVGSITGHIGGGGYVLPADQYIYYGHITIYVK